MKILGIGNAIVDVICKVEDDFITKNKLTKNNQIFYSTLVSVIGFCIFILFAFLYLEIDSYDPSYSYQPPLLIDGKVKDGNFSK